MTLVKKLNIFLKSIPIAQLSKEICKTIDLEEKDVKEKLLLYINEAQATFNLIETSLNKKIHMLEIGAGLCILALFLKKEGYNITALEPVASGFDFFSTAQKVIINHFHYIDIPILFFPAEELQKKNIGQFDLIFSFNVLEHIMNPFSTLLVLVKQLSKGGKMIHSCPNYTIPYEPHFGIPVLKVWPELSTFFYRKKISNRQALWNSLNFITYFEVNRFVKKHKLTVTFSKGLLYNAIIRRNNDPMFRKRQDNPFIKSFLFLIHFLGGPILLKKLPPYCATPMSFTISFE